jgi:hypothetical protein
MGGRLGGGYIVSPAAKNGQKIRLSRQKISTNPSERQRKHLDLAATDPKSRFLPGKGFGQKRPTKANEGQRTPANASETGGVCGLDDGDPV